MNLFNSVVAGKLAGGGSGGSGGGGADIDVIAEAGQIIRVKAVDADGKPTEWESAEYPVGAKIYTKDDLKSMTKEELKELEAEYKNHPLIYRIVTPNYERADMLLHFDNIGDCYGAAFTRYPNWAASVRIAPNDTTGKLIIDERDFTMCTMASGSREGFVYHSSSGDCGVRSIEDIANSINIEIAIAELPVEYLVDGVTLPMPIEDYYAIISTYNKIPNLVIRTTVDGAQLDLNALSVSTNMTTYATAVRILSPTTNDIITINFTFAAE